MRSRQRLFSLLAVVLAAGFAPLPAAADQTAAPAPATASLPGSTAAAAAPAIASSAPAVPTPVQTRPVAAPAPASPVTGPSAGNLLQTIFALTVVLGVLFGLAWFMKRYGPKAGTGSANLHIVGALNLGGRERILVVELGDQWIVVGASPGRINTLATLPKQEGVASQATPGGQVSTAPGFSEWLKQTIEKRNAK